MKKIKNIKTIVLCSLMVIDVLSLVFLSVQMKKTNDMYIYNYDFTSSESLINTTKSYEIFKGDLEKKSYNSAYVSDNGEMIETYTLDSVEGFSLNQIIVKDELIGTYEGNEVINKNKGVILEINKETSSIKVYQYNKYQVKMSMEYSAFYKTDFSKTNYYYEYGNTRVSLNYLFTDYASANYETIDVIFSLDYNESFLLNNALINVFKITQNYSDVYYVENGLFSEKGTSQIMKYEENGQINNINIQCIDILDNYTVIDSTSLKEGMIIYE